MADDTKPAATPRGIRARIARFLESRGGTVTEAAPRPVRMADEDGWDAFLADPVSLNALAGTANRQIRSRAQLYEKWQDMLADPVISSALRLHVTTALGGHESRGDMVFIELAPAFKGKADAEALIAELAADLQPLFNRIAPVLAFNAVAFGDGYGRMYGKPGVGLVDVNTDEQVYPPLVQPFERGTTTMGFLVATGERYTERVTLVQMLRMKMPRMLYVPQSRVLEKAVRQALKEDDPEKLPALPALAGGSFLDGAESAYDKFAAAWAGLTGQRVRDSISESLISVTQTGMTTEQRAALKSSLVRMIEASNAYVNKVVASGKAVFHRIFHFLPTSGEKQIVQITGNPGQGGSSTSTLTIDDVMMNARFLGGALGVDISMIGFADQMSGGLGEGGFFRISAHAGERARMIRSSLTEALEHAIAVHLLLKKGVEVTRDNKVWQISYYSDIGALETERAKTKADNINSAALMVQTLQQLKELGFDKAAAQHFMEQQMGLDAEEAKKYAAALEKAIKDAKAAEAAANGGGFGGAGGGDMLPGGPAEGEPVETAEG